MSFLIEASEIASFNEAQIPSPNERPSETKIGGKAMNLARLSRHGFPVPTWCVLTQAPKTPEEKNEIAKWIESRRNEGHGRFIVRSSMVGEDGASLSFAGQLESFPNLTNLEGILKAVDRCIASANSERVAAYRGDRALGSVAVILQVMIDADRSGVMFTADPKDGSRRRFLISSAFGACEAVVGGHFDCDEFEVDAGSFATVTRIAHKTRALKFADGEGLLEYTLPKNLQDQATLNPTELRELVTMGRRLTTWQNHPLDIEWVHQGGRLWIVQMRPITSLSPDISKQHDFAFDNSNIQESYNGLTLPMTFDFASEAYHKVYSQIMELMGFGANKVAQHDRRHQQMLALVKGRVYYNINSWYEGLLLLPSFGRNKADMEHMMGVEEPVSFVVDQTLNRKQKLARLPKMIALLARLGWSFARIDSKVSNFRREFQNAYASFPREELRWKSPQQLFAMQDQLKRRVLGHWKAPIINDFFVMMMSGRVRRRLVKVNLEHRVPDLLAGEDLESTRPTKMLLRIADRIRKSARLRDALRTGDAEFNLALHRDPQLNDEISEYIEMYGDRVIGELKLETETLRQNQSFMLRVLRSYVTDDSLNLEELEARQKQTREMAETEVFGAVKKGLGRRALRSFRKDLGKFRKAVAFREAMRLDRTRSFGLFRSLALTYGEKLKEQNFLDDSRDIFYLKFDEIDDFFHGKSLFDDPRSLVAQRKNQYVVWAQIQPPAHFETSIPLRGLPEPVVIASSGEMKGLGCCPGVIEAEVVVVKDPSLPIDLAGKIMVAERTDPGWTPLFLQIEGLIVERGSQLSHSAVVARELGLPTVVGVPGVCVNLKTGDRVRLDGQTGLIIQLTPKKSSEIHPMELMAGQ